MKKIIGSLAALALCAPLLASAARLYAAELHFVVPRWTRQGSVERRLRHRLRDLGLHPNRIWSV